ncbi:unnamed protein product [Dibothriocephalus latus]|uniref:Uncharacterized protein n=1 Tax=Dibothriocephalus latus TaxID=60516 RepID=A0A3P7LZK5_DIBLA|nr:unnamed protein product [Dibothriocephalus latus]
MENPPPELFLYVYDELAESRVRLRRKDYETFLLKWGVDAKKAEELPQEILKRIEPIYGKGWTIYVTDGRVWAMQVHQPGSNLVFAYKGNVYGLYQCPVGK